MHVLTDADTNTDTDTAKNGAYLYDKRCDLNCLFCKIVAGDIPCKRVYEDDEVLAFHDIRPSAPVHFLIIPKTHIESLAHAQPEHALLLSKMFLLAPKLAAEQGSRTGRDGGFRVLTNTGSDGGQEVFHLHLHVMGGARPW
jgi:histidine triad (HIT) family protein